MIAAIVGTFWALILLQILLCKCTPYPRQEEILPPDNGAGCMEGSFNEW